MPKQKRIGKASRVRNEKMAKLAPPHNRTEGTLGDWPNSLDWKGREGIEHVGIYMGLPSNAPRALARHRPAGPPCRPNCSFPFRTPKPNAAYILTRQTTRRSAARNLPSYRL